jgi:hypothetical protein
MKRTFINNEKGIALLTTLMLMVLGFGLVATLLSMVTYGTKTTGLEQEYATALDAAKGGADLVINMAQRKLYTPPSLGGATGASADCMEQKMTMQSLGDNVTGNWRSCTAQATTYDPKTSPDVTLTLSNHIVYVKIIDTRITASITTTNYFHTIIVRAEALSGPGRADIVSLYQVREPVD